MEDSVDGGLVGDIRKDAVVSCELHKLVVFHHFLIFVNVVTVDVLQGEVKFWHELNHGRRVYKIDQLDNLLIVHRPLIIDRLAQGYDKVFN